MRKCDVERAITTKHAHFIGDGNYHDILIDIRDRLDWRIRPKR